MVIAQAWTSLGEGIAPLSNAAGRPLARTVRLILDPLVIRPVHRPNLGAALISLTDAEELARTIAAGGDDLRATAAWFVVLKKARRRLGITAGNPQDLYFQRCYELARTRGGPGPDAAVVAAEAVADIHDSTGRVTAAELRAYLTEPARRGELQGLIERTWTAVDRTRQSTPSPALGRFLDTCAAAPDDGLFNALVRRAAGSATAAALAVPGAARALGLTEHDAVRPPVIGETASKSALPSPFDRSILERLFAGLGALARDAVKSVALSDVVTAEIYRAAGTWQLADEPSRILMAAGREASGAITDEAAVSVDAAARLRARWRREPFVQRAMRLPDQTAETSGVREAYMRRLWVRLHGRELRGNPVTAAQAWDVLDGALRSVILDRRDRLKAGLEREALSAASAATESEGR